MYVLAAGIFECLPNVVGFGVIVTPTVKCAMIRPRCVFFLFLPLPCCFSTLHFYYFFAALPLPSDGSVPNSMAGHTCLGCPFPLQRGQHNKLNFG